MIKHDLQWRASSNPLGKYELGKADWGWSWKERWIAARPWESRVPSPSISPKKVQRKQGSKVGKDPNPLTPKVGKETNPPTPKVGKGTNPPTPKSSISVKPSISNARGATKARRLSFPAAEKPSSNEGKIEAEEERAKKEQQVS